MEPHGAEDGFWKAMKKYENCAFLLVMILSLIKILVFCLLNNSGSLSAGHLS
jgi:hypothetical protein